MPISSRPASSTVTSSAAADSRAPITNASAVTRMTRRRPKRSDRLPATIAPITAPTSTMPATRLWPAVDRWKTVRTNSSALEITPVS